MVTLYSDPVMAKRSQDHIYLQTVPRAVAAMAKTYPRDYAGYRHHHVRAQLLYAASGCIRLTFDLGRWIVPPKRAVWLPAEYPHQTGSIGSLDMRTLYIRGDACPKDAPQIPRMLAVSQLLHELVMRSTMMPVEYDEKGHDAQIIATLLGEIDWTPVHPVSVPSLHDNRLRRMEKILLSNAGGSGTLEDVAARLAVSPRTLTRHLRKEAHLSFQAWRDQIRASLAIPMLIDGRPLAEIADAVGYETAWSFTTMFKRVTGKAPSRYAAEHNEQMRQLGHDLSK